MIMTIEQMKDNLASVLAAAIRIGKLPENLQIVCVMSTPMHSEISLVAHGVNPHSVAGILSSASNEAALAVSRDN